MEELKQQLQHFLDITEDFSGFRSLFSENSAEKSIAQMRQTIRQIQAFVAISEFKEVEFRGRGEAITPSERTGSFVRVKPVGDRFEGRTFLGIYLGDVAVAPSLAINQEEKLIAPEWGRRNPGILIPEEHTVVYGYESWWGFLKSPEDLEAITDADIESVWYVQALKQLMKKKDE